MKAGWRTDLILLQAASWLVFACFGVAAGSQFDLVFVYVDVGFGVEEANSMVIKLANVCAKEKALLRICKGLLSMLVVLKSVQTRERSLKRPDSEKNIEEGDC
ncbi:hypothetical protein L2E82_50032 [Cichorium intybus]|nr:hypothetical protein L2E82_50032 [Cichorium intybus]